MTVVDNIVNFKKAIPNTVKLVAVSKFHTPNTVLEAYSTGHRIFGESRMQEIDDKHKLLPNDIEWHFIGHLQRNKVKTILPYTHTIHSVDSVRLFDEIEKQANASEKQVCCLIQIHIANEVSKYGFDEEECLQFLDTAKWEKSKYAYIGGLMGMATNTDDENRTREEFRRLKKFFDKLKTSYFSNNDTFKEISMGMSNDYTIAIEEGATMIRVGSTIFANRE